MSATIVSQLKAISRGLDELPTLGCDIRGCSPDYLTEFAKDNDISDVSAMTEPEWQDAFHDMEVCGQCDTPSCPIVTMRKFVADLDSKQMIVHDNSATRITKMVDGKLYELMYDMLKDCSHCAFANMDRECEELDRFGLERLCFKLHGVWCEVAQ